MAVEHVVRSANRFELKYILPRRRATEIIHCLEDYVHADSHARDERGYPIQSVYCDSQDRALFWEKIEGLKFRRKLRFRSYGDGESVYLEIKQRVDRTLQKRRVRWPQEKLTRCFFSGGEPSIPELESAEGRDPVLVEILFLWNYYGLAPSMGISYLRRAFFADHEPDLRITFDTHLKYHANDFDLSRPLADGKYLIDPDCAIMEVKFADRVPIWLCKVLSENEAGVTRFSKYCTAVDREYFQSQLT